MKGPRRLDRHQGVIPCLVLSLAMGCGLLERLQEEERKAEDERMAEAIGAMAMEGFAKLERRVDAGVERLAGVLEAHPYRGGPAQEHREHPSFVEAAGVAEQLRTNLSARCIVVEVEFEGARFPVSGCADELQWSCEGEGIGEKYPLRSCHLAGGGESSSVSNIEAERALSQGTLHVELVDIASKHEGPMSDHPL